MRAATSRKKSFRRSPLAFPNGVSGGRHFYDAKFCFKVEAWVGRPIRQSRVKTLPILKFLDLDIAAQNAKMRKEASQVVQSLLISNTSRDLKQTLQRDPSGPSQYFVEYAFSAGPVAN